MSKSNEDILDETLESLKELELKRKEYENNIKEISKKEKRIKRNYY